MKLLLNFHSILSYFKKYLYFVWNGSYELVWVLTKGFSCPINLTTYKRTFLTF